MCPTGRPADAPRSRKWGVEEGEEERWRRRRRRKRGLARGAAVPGPAGEQRRPIPFVVTHGTTSLGCASGGHRRLVCLVTVGSGRQLAVGGASPHVGEQHLGAHHPSPGSPISPTFVRCNSRRMDTHTPTTLSVWGGGDPYGLLVEVVHGRRSVESIRDRHLGKVPTRPHLERRQGADDGRGSEPAPLPCCFRQGSRFSTAHFSAVLTTAPAHPTRSRSGN